MDPKGDRIRDEFLAEAQEIIEALSRDLLSLDEAQKTGRFDPDLVNEIFRGVHTLKGIAGMFGYHQLGALAHALEDLLEDLRLGRVDVTQAVLDVLFDGVENFQKLISAPTADTPATKAVDLDAYAKALEGVTAPQATGAHPLERYALDSAVLGVLTEYEEHRLRTNAEQNVPLYKLTVRLSLASIDSALEDLKQRAKPLAEIITYLPSMDSGDSDALDLDVLLASRASEEELTRALCDAGATLVRIEERSEAMAGGPAQATAPPREVPRTSTALAEPRQATARTPAPPAPIPQALAADPASSGGEAMSLRSVASTVRVDIRKLDHLMNVVGELAIVRSAVARLTDRLRERAELRQIATDLHRIHRGFERQLEVLQEGILDVRMVPLGQVFDRLGRVVRQVAREHEKQVRLVVTGAETEVDKLIVEELSDPLMHLIRNAVDHGIEAPKVREIAGKPPAGTLSLDAFQKGNNVVIEVDDDGGGMDTHVLVEHAVRKGLLTEAESRDLSRPEILGLIFLPGFSTRATATDTSGRGVGMDVVKTNISRLGGVVDVHSELGVGTRFTITLPITLAIISALVVKVAGRTYAVPLTAVQEAIALDPRSVRTVEGREVMTLRGATLPVCRLERLFELSPESPLSKHYIVVSEIGNRRVGFVVDELEGQQDIVIKPLGKSLAAVKGFAGATDLGDQRVALVLDAPSLLEEVLAGTERLGVAGALAS